MYKKLAKLRYLPNKFEVIQDGDHVICSISKKKNFIGKFKLLEC